MPVNSGAVVPQPAQGKLPPNPLNLGAKAGVPASSVAPHITTPGAPYIFHATPGELPPGDPRRMAALNMIAHHISTAVDATPFADQLKAMNITPEEENFINGRLKDLHAASSKAQLHDLTHTVLPALANAPLGFVGTDVKHVKYAVEHPVGRLESKGPFQVKKGAVMGGNDFPFISGPEKAVEVAADVGKVGRTAEEAGQHVAEAARQARAQGHGAIGPQTAHHIPLLEKGAVTPETGGELGAQVRQALSGHTPEMGKYEKIGAKLDNPTLGMSAAQARAVQAELYTAERTQRAARVAEALKHEDPHAAFAQALGHLKGELPKIDFQGFKHFDVDALTAMKAHIRDTPNLRDLQKVRASDALDKAIAGKVPTKSEQLLLERAFGRETGQDVVQSAGFWKKAGRGALEVINIPRAVQAAFDLSAPFRQGLVVAAYKPSTFFKGFAPMLKAAKSEDFFQGLQHEIQTRPTFPLMQKAKLSLVDIGTDAQHGAGSLVDREEQFMSNLAERIPGIGHGVRVSDRAYVGFLNKMRADVFDDLVEQAAKDGVDLNDEKQLQDIGRIVNAFTGRGDLGKLQSAGPLLNSIFFSPRLLASRLNLIFGIGRHGIPGEYYMSLSPFARRQALVAMRNLVGTTSLVLWLAKLSGADVNLDPTNADFGKIKLGNTRLDILGGFQQPVRLFAQVFEGHITSSTTGKSITLTQQGFGKLSRKDIIQRFIESKFAPVPSTINDVLSNKNFQGQPLSLKNEAYSHLVPLLAQDLADLERNSGPLATVGGAVPAVFGVGLQTYKPKTPSSGGGGGGSSSGYGDTGSYGGGSSYGSSGGYGH